MEINQTISYEGFKSKSELSVNDSSRNTQQIEYLIQQQVKFNLLQVSNFCPSTSDRIQK